MISEEGLRELDEKYGMCSSQSILSNYTVMLRSNVLFRGFRQNPISIIKFQALFFTEAHPENEMYQMFINPERFRYNYMIDYIHSNRTRFSRVLFEEEHETQGSPDVSKQTYRNS
jgi:hypothetical protein